MNVEKINQEDYLEREEKMPFRKFLSEQISLLRNDWSLEFKNYIEEKFLENKERSSPDITLEQIRKIDFERYLKFLDISEEDLKDKKILDLGCGTGNFIKEIIDKNYTHEGYGLDTRIGSEVKFKGDEEKYVNHFFKGDFSEDFPVKNLDYVIAVGSVEIPMDSKEGANPKKTLLNAIEALNDNGEIRIYPVRKTYPDSEAEGFKFSMQEWKRILDELVQEKEIEYEFRPMDIQVMELANKTKDVWLDELLIVRKNKGVS